MAYRITEEDLGRTAGADCYFEMILEGRDHLDRTIEEIAGDAARIALRNPDVIDSYNMNPASVTRAVIAEVIGQTFSTSIIENEAG